MAGFIKRYDTATGTVRGFATGIAGPVDVRVMGDGKLLYLSQSEGKVYSVNFVTPSAGLLADGSVGTASQRFVAGVYRDLLGREIGLGEIRAGILDADAAYVGQFGPAAFVRTIDGSPEARGRLIEDRYVAYLGRSAEPAGRDGWVRFFQGGGTVEQFEAALLASPEYLSRYANDIPRVVDAWYADILGRPADQAGKDAYVTAIRNGSSSLNQALSGFLNSQEYRAKVVGSYYSAYLLRQPDAAGHAGWVAQLGSGVRDEDVLAMILGNPAHEYFNRVVF